MAIGKATTRFPYTLGECPGCGQQLTGSATAELALDAMTTDTDTNTTSVGIKITGLDLRHNCIKAVTR